MEIKCSKYITKKNYIEMPTFVVVEVVKEYDHVRGLNTIFTTKCKQEAETVIEARKLTQPYTPTFLLEIQNIIRRDQIDDMLEEMDLHDAYLSFDRDGCPTLVVSEEVIDKIPLASLKEIQKLEYTGRPNTGD